MSKKAKTGSETQSERLQMRTTPSFLQKVEEWRATQRPIPSLSDAIRILTEAGIEAEIAKKKGKR